MVPNQAHDKSTGQQCQERYDHACFDPDSIRSLVVLTFSKMQPSQVWSFHCRLGSNCNSFFELQSLMCSLTESAERHLQLPPLWPPQHLSLTQPFMSTTAPSKIALHISSLPRSRHSCHHSNVKRKLEVIRKAVDKSIPRVVLELDTTCLERHASLSAGRFLDLWTNTQSATSRPRTPGDPGRQHHSLISYPVQHCAVHGSIHFQIPASVFVLHSPAVARMLHEQRVQPLAPRSHRQGTESLLRPSFVKGARLK